MTHPSSLFTTPERNPLTHIKHRKQVFWQITFPLIIFGLLFAGVLVALLVMTIREAQLDQSLPQLVDTVGLEEVPSEAIMIMRYDQGSTARLANISQMWLLLPILLILFLTAAVLIGLAYLITKLLVVLPGGMLKAQHIFALIDLRLQHITNMVVEPLLKAKSISAAVGKINQMTKQQASTMVDWVAAIRKKLPHFE